MAVDERPPSEGRRLIDANGRLLGRVNVIDAAAIALLIAVLACLIQLSLLPRREAPAIDRLPAETTGRRVLEIDVLLPCTAEWLLPRIHEGDEQRGTIAQNAVRITGIRHQEVPGCGSATVVSFEIVTPSSSRPAAPPPWTSPGAPFVFRAEDYTLAGTVLSVTRR